ncbi:protein SpAN-like [Antedon mediterranea]|uniref:protein SpAN-like n=1 Tax=Antedon mediterranea TaxID=105859 RepID=UPI003AF88D3F
MHYSQWAFSKNTYNPDYATMVAHDPMKQDSMGQHGRLSHLDKLFSNKHYSCMDHCSEAELDQPCLYGGFVGKYCTCECPEGLEGPYCEVMTPSITEDCGGHFTEDNGEITSPNYPSNYPVLVSCNYLITAPEGYTIELTFDDDFYIEDETYCYWDQLLIRHDSPMYYNAAARFCGDTLAGETVTSLSNVMYVNLYSDDYITEHGFRATYTFVGRSLTDRIQFLQKCIHSKITHF